MYLLVSILLIAIIVSIILLVTKDTSTTTTSNTIQWLATNSNQIIYSYNGIIWRDNGVRGVASNFQGRNVQYGTDGNNQKLWVAAGNLTSSGLSNSKLIYSEDGISWNNSTGEEFNSTVNGIGYGTSNGTSALWIVTGDDTPALKFSGNGKNWSDCTGSDFSIQGFDAAYGTSNGTSPLWVAVGDDGTNPSVGNIMFSENGISWEKVSSGISFLNVGYSVAYGTSNGTSPLWVAVGESVDTILYSENGKEWQASSGVSFNGTGFGVAYGYESSGSPLWVVAGYDSGDNYKKLLYSTNGKEWQASSSSGVSFTSSSENFYGAVGSNLLPPVFTKGVYPAPPYV